MMAAETTTPPPLLPPQQTMSATSLAREEYILQRLALQWVNEVLVRWPRATSLHNDFANGARLIALAEALTDRPVVGYIANPRMLLDKLSNVRTAVFHLEQAWRVTVVGVSPDDVVRGNASHILQLIAFLAITVSPFHKFVDRVLKCKGFTIEITTRPVAERRRTVSSKKLHRKASEFAIAPLKPLLGPLAGEVPSSASSFASLLPVGRPRAFLSAESTAQMFEAKSAAAATGTAASSSSAASRMPQHTASMPLFPLSPPSAAASAAVGVTEGALSPPSPAEDEMLAGSSAATPGSSATTAASAAAELDDKLQELVTELRLGQHGAAGSGDFTSTVQQQQQQQQQRRPDMSASSPTLPQPQPTTPREKSPAQPPTQASPVRMPHTPRGQQSGSSRRRRKVCRRRNLERVPSEFWDSLSSVLSIDVSCNKLREFPLDVLEATHLRELNVASNRISALPSQLIRLTTLRILYLSLNTLSALPELVFRLPSLTELFASHCGIAALEIPSEGRVAPLEVLDLTDNRIAALPHSIGMLRKLRVLHLDKNKLHDLPDELSNATHLTELRAAENGLRKLHSSTVRWTRLERLELYENKLKALPTTWFDGRAPAPPILHMQLQKNRFEELPVSFFQAMNGLVSLDLSENHLKFLPASISSATHLESLYLGGNQLLALPPVVGLLESLIFLDVSRNRLSKLPDLTGCTRLNALTFGFNPLATFPSELPPSLSELHMSGCGCKVLPHYKLPKLEAFMVACNQLTFADFRNTIDPDRIQYIDISHNKLTALPQGMFSARDDCALELDFSHNLFALAVNDPALVKPASCEPRLRVGMSEMQGRRDGMEDVVCILGDITGDGTTDLIAVYDGHGGADVATLASRAVAQCLKETLTSTSGADAETIVVECLQRTNRLFENQTPTTMQGSTVLLGLFVGAPPNRTLHCINIGDSRAVLCRGGKAVRLSYDHKPLLEEEYARVTGAGGFISQEGSIQGIVSVSRALGDYPLRPYVTDEPRCSRWELRPEDEFAIFACDGLWDVVSDKDAVRIAREALSKGQDPSSVSLLLRDWAYLSGSADNISVIVAVINDPIQQATAAAVK